MEDSPTGIKVFSWLAVLATITLLIAKRGAGSMIPLHPVARLQ